MGSISLTTRFLRFAISEIMCMIFDKKTVTDHKRARQLNNEGSLESIEGFKLR